MRLISLIFLFVFSVSLTGKGQQSNIKTAYYLDINNKNSLLVHNVSSPSLMIQYHDKIGREETIPLKLYSWESKEMASFVLSKSYGLNHFKVNLEASFSEWKVDEVYRCQIVDETGQKHELLLRKTIPNTKELDIELLVNPLSLNCEAISGNLVDFYATVNGGKAPYIVNWYIVDNSRNNLLYQPRKQEIQTPGKSGVVRVESNPDYYVMVLVTDACGNEEKDMVYMVCDEKKKKVNTLFVEPIQKLPEPAKNLN